MRALLAQVPLLLVLAWGLAITVAYFLNAKLTFGASIRHSRFMNYVFIQAVGAGNV